MCLLIHAKSVKGAIGEFAKKSCETTVLPRMFNKVWNIYISNSNYAFASRNKYSHNNVNRLITCYCHQLQLWQTINLKFQITFKTRIPASQDIFTIKIIWCIQNNIVETFTSSLTITVQFDEWVPGKTSRVTAYLWLNHSCFPLVKGGTFVLSQHSQAMLTNINYNT